MSSKQEALGRLAEAFERLPLDLATKVSLKPGNLGEEDLPALLPNERLLSFPVAISARFLGLQEQTAQNQYVEVSALVVMRADEGFGVLAPKAAFAATGQGKTETWLSLLIQASLAAPAPPLRPEQGVCVQAGPNSFVDLSLIEDFRERKLPPPLLASLEQKIKAIPVPWVLHFEITALGLASAELCRQLAAQASAPQEAAQASAAPAATKPKRKTKKAKEEADSEALIISALAKHHNYGQEVSLDLTPVKVRSLAEDLGLAPSTVSEFFRKKFGGYKAYCLACRDKEKLRAALKLLQGEYAPRILLSVDPEDKQEEDTSDFGGENEDD